MILREETAVKRKNNMPFLDPEELKPKLKKIFETVVIPQIKKANMKQTAVEWLIQELFNNGYFHYGVPDEIVDQAKVMEKQEIKDAWDGGYDKGTRDRIEKISNPVGNAEQYYNETFKSE
jgi:hypothetical protein